MTYARPFFILLLAAGAALAQTGWKAGVAKTVVTPKESIWLAGFGFRNKPSEGVRQDLYVRALALQDEGGKPAVILTLDLAALDRSLADAIADRCRTRHGVARDRLVINISHTHSGPVTGPVIMPLYELTAAQRAVIERYTKELIEKSVATAGAAIAALAPARLEFEQGLAGIAVNRRRVSRRELPGPVDHDVPTLAVRDAKGALVAVAVGYACHATALNDYLISNDWPGFALAAIEKSHPGAVALFVQGCGADSNSLPRGGEELAQQHGARLAAAVEQVLKAKMRPLSGPLVTALDTVSLPFHNLMTRAEAEKLAQDKAAHNRACGRYFLAEFDRKGKLPDHYPNYPVQVWRFGQGLKFVALAGEVVVDYSLRLKGEYGFADTWVAGYSNDLPAYIPSRRVLREGGYEGGEALIYFGRPGRFGAAVEEIIVEKVADLMERTAKP
jgi:hypothetical protein